MTDRSAPLSPDASGPGYPALLPLALVTLVALAVRGLYFTQFSHNPWFHYTVADEQIYDGIAWRIVSGKPGWTGAFYQPPGYALFLSFLYAVLGRDLAAVRLAQLALGAVNVGLLYLVGRRVFGPAPGLVAALLLALYGPMLFFEGMLLPPVLVVFLDLAFFLALLACLERPRWWLGLAAGLLLGASAATMSVVLPFAAVALVFAGWRLTHGAGTGARRRPALLAIGAAFLLGVVAPVAACTVHNWVVARKLVFISDNFGINLYLGSGADFERKVAIRPGKEWQALTSSPARAGRADDPSGYFTERAVQIIRSDPAGYAGSLLRKLFLFAHGHELKRNQAIYPYRRYSWLLSVLVWKHGLAWPFGVLFPFAVLGMIHSVRERNPGAHLLLLFCLCHLLFLLPFFIAARYRMNVVPFLLLFAVHGGNVLLDALRGRRWRATWACALVLVAFGVLCNWRVGEMSEHPDADQYGALAENLRYEGRGDEAAAVLAEAARVRPPAAPGEEIPQRTSSLLVAAGALALLGYRKLTR